MILLQTVGRQGEYQRSTRISAFLGLRCVWIAAFEALLLAMWRGLLKAFVRGTLYQRHVLLGRSTEMACGTMLTVSRRA